MPHDAGSSAASMPMPPPRGVGIACEERAFGRSRMTRRRSWRSTAPVASPDRTRAITNVAARGGAASSTHSPLIRRSSFLCCLLALAADCPFDRRGRRPVRPGADLAAEDDLLRLLHLAGTEIDALGEAHLRALRAQAQTASARQAEEGGAALLDERDLDGRMVGEADREARARRSGLALPAGQIVLAAQIVAVGGEEELARMGQAELGGITVMRGADPQAAL